MDFDAADIVPPRHRSARPLDQCPDILNAPDRNAAAEPHRCGKAAGFDAGPPCGFRDRNRSTRAKYRGYSDEALLGKGPCLLGAPCGVIDRLHVFGFQRLQWDWTGLIWKPHVGMSERIFRIRENRINFPEVFDRADPRADGG
jgi:hypothetical protein